MSKYIISILLLLLTATAWAQQDTTRVRPGDVLVVTTDSVANDSSLIIRDSLEVDTVLTDSVALSDSARSSMIAERDSLHQLRFGFDISKPLMKLLTKDSLSFRETFELEVDFYHKKEIYLVAEGGWGSGRVDYPDLSYRTKNIFVKGGINKSLLVRRGVTDWDQAFIGARYGVAFINRSDANYETDSNAYWGKIVGTIPGRNLTAHWFEVTAGTRLEVWRGIFVGWNARGKFRLNKKAFQDLPPYFIAGYGKGDKNFIFDFNFYLSYAIRWK
ncbi:MAG: hypothetical protein EOP56_13815 [Sphingobacteriales bacterium]|nr:MAG: hypothetical protein EOP56_13815 [Sphingobacteriales bacterium]